MEEAQQVSILELQKFTVCQLSDALGPTCPIETALRPIDPESHICGSALTVECSPGDNLSVHQALHLANPGDVLVVSNPKNGEAALWGELMTISAQCKRLSGTIIDGSVRDPLEIRRLGYPVFCREFNPRRAAKENCGRINVPVQIGTLSVKPGDVLVSDLSGIISIPAPMLQHTISLVSEVARKEREIKEQILSGRSIFEILELGSCIRPTS
ncbi:MAG TPA: RraA family protein [Terriglobales bacterium]|nr:RraA family protein [Terriglobales bacterium]